MRETKVYNVDMNIDCFIIPNKACIINKQVYMGEKLMKRSQELAGINNFYYNPDLTRMVQIWCVNNDPNNSCDNMQDHGFKYKIGDTIYSFNLDTYLPETFFQDKREGDFLDLNIPLYPRYAFNKEDGVTSYDAVFDENEIIAEPPLFNFRFSIKLNQRGYRYRNFGDFEEVLNTVTFH